jgi:spore coat protein U-like protein
MATSVAFVWLDPAVAARNCHVKVLPTIFGTYLPAQASPTDTAGSIQLRCVGRPRASQPTFVTVNISGGSSGLAASRFMQSGTAPLAYNLFKDAARIQVWGDGTNGTTGLVQTVPSDQKVVRVEIPVYGRIPAQQDAVPGSYDDTVIVTVEF